MFHNQAMMYYVMLLIIILIGSFTLRTLKITLTILIMINVFILSLYSKKVFVLVFYKILFPVNDKSFP